MSLDQIPKKIARELLEKCICLLPSVVALTIHAFAFRLWSVCTKYFGIPYCHTLPGVKRENWIPMRLTLAYSCCGHKRGDSPIKITISFYFICQLCGIFVFRVIFLRRIWRNITQRWEQMCRKNEGEYLFTRKCHELIYTAYLCWSLVRYIISFLARLQ